MSLKSNNSEIQMRFYPYKPLKLSISQNTQFALTFSHLPYYDHFRVSYDLNIIPVLTLRKIAIWMSKHCQKLSFFSKNYHWQFFLKKKRQFLSSFLSIFRRVSYLPQVCEYLNIIWQSQQSISPRLLTVRLGCHVVRSLQLLVAQVPYLQPAILTARRWITHRWLL